MPTGPKRIGIAVVAHQGRYLVGVRGPDVPLAGFSEFPGGKCLDGESAAACAVRECREETGLAVTSVSLIERTEFEYEHGRVDLHFFLCHPTAERDVRDQHQSYRWVTASELAKLIFPEANADVIKRLVSAKF